MKVALGFSGGLDTSYCVAWLRESESAEVVTVTVDTGGMSRAELDGVRAQATRLGAVEHREVDARRATYDGFVATLIRGNVLRGGVYPVAVAAERTQQAIELARVAREVGATAVAHGSTGAGNDQVRFDVALRALLPGTPIVTPIRDRGVSRAAAIEYLTARGLPVPPGSGRYSVNRGLWGTTLGGEWTHEPWSPPPADAWGAAAVPSPSPGSTQELVLAWREGLPVALDGAPLEGPALVEALDARLQGWGVGRGIHVGETVLGIKGRIGFEAGAALVLIQAHRELEKLVLTRWQSFWKDHLAQFWGDRLHEGHAFDPVMRDVEAMIVSSQRRVEGETRVLVSVGGFQVTGARSPYSLFNPGVARYGEDNGLWNGDEARAFAKLSAVPEILVALREGDLPW